MIHRIIGFILGGITIYVILNLSTIIGDPQPRYFAAILIGLAVIALYPWLIGIWFVRRRKDKRDEEIQARSSGSWRKRSRARTWADRPDRPLSFGLPRIVRSPPSVRHDRSTWTTTFPRRRRVRPNS